MTGTVSIQPFVQSVGNAGLFSVGSGGYRQGTAMADPATRFRLRAGILAATETLPMWGGVGVYADVPGNPLGTVSAAYSQRALGPILGRAVSLTDAAKPLLGFSVTDEAYGMITSPQSPVPLATSLMQVNYYPLGSLARVVVQADPSLVSLRGGPLNANVSWDFTNQLLVPYLGTLTVAATGSSYNSTTGIVSLNMSVAPAFDAGDSVTVASLTGTGADLAKANGTFTVLSVVGNIITYAIATGLTITTITGGNVTVGGAASAALNVKVLDINDGNSEVVVYNAANGFATYSFTGTTALIQL